MAQVIQRVCDQHLRESENVAGAKQYRVELLLPGWRKVRAFNVDLCDECGQALSAMAELMAELDPDAAQPRLGRPAHDDPRPPGDIRCPAGCDAGPWRTMSGLRTHVRRDHEGMTLPQLLATLGSDQDGGASGRSKHG